MVLVTIVTILFPGDHGVHLGLATDLFEGVNTSCIVAGAWILGFEGLVIELCGSDNVGETFTGSAKRRSVKAAIKPIIPVSLGEMMLDALLTGAQGHQMLLSNIAVSFIFVKHARNNVFCWIGSGYLLPGLLDEDIVWSRRCVKFSIRFLQSTRFLDVTLGFIGVVGLFVNRSHIKSRLFSKTVESF